MNKAWLTPKEYAQETDLSIATVRRRLADGTIHYEQPGGKGTKIMIPVSQLPTFLRKGDIEDFIEEVR